MIWFTLPTPKSHVSMSESRNSSGLESRSPRKLENKEHKDISPRRGRERQRQVSKTTEPPPLPDRNTGVSGVSRRLSDRKHEVMEGQRANIQQKIRRKSRRSSSLGPLLDGNLFPGHDLGTRRIEIRAKISPIRLYHSLSKGIQHTTYTAM